MNVSASSLNPYAAPRETLAQVARRQAEAVDSAALVDSVLGTNGAPRDGAALANAAQGGGAFLSMLASLLQQGIVGAETLEVRGEAYTSFLDTRIAAPDDISRARRFDLRA